MVEKLGIAEAIDEQVHLPERHKPYQECNSPSPQLQLQLESELRICQHQYEAMDNHAGLSENDRHANGPGRGSAEETTFWA